MAEFQRPSLNPNHPQSPENFRFIGTLGDFKLGHAEGGISSDLDPSNPGFSDYLYNLLSTSTKKVEISDENKLSCVDGRNSDSGETYFRIAGAYLSYIFARSFHSIVNPATYPEEGISLDGLLSDVKAPFIPSTHDQNCAAANNFLVLVKNINLNKEILNAVESIVNNHDLLGLSLDGQDKEGISSNLSDLATMIESVWNIGQFKDFFDSKPDETFTEKIRHSDEHQERAILFVKGDYSLNKTMMADNSLGQAFVVNLEAIKRIADSVGEADNDKNKIIFALVSFQLSVFSTLCNENMPIILVDLEENNIANI